MFKSCLNFFKKSDSNLNITKLGDKECMKESKRRSKEIERELKKSRKLYRSTIKLLLLGTGESGKSTVLKQMRIIHISKFTDEERMEKINDIKSNIRDSILSILDAMDRFNIKFENDNLNESKEFIYEYSYLLIETKPVDSSIKQKLWDCIQAVWKDQAVKKCAKRGNEYHLIDSAEYFLDRIGQIRLPNYLPSEQDILRCRVLTTGINEAKFQEKKVNFHIFDVGGQRDQRKKWIQCFNQVTAIIYVVDISSFNMTLREDNRVNRLRESLQSFRQIWINRYLYHISIILFLNKYDLFVKKIVEEHSRLEDYFPDYKFFKTPNYIDKHLVIPNEHPEVTRAKMYILDLFIKITNEDLTDALRISAKYDLNSTDNVKENKSGINLLNYDQTQTNDSDNDNYIYKHYKHSYHIDHRDDYSNSNGKFCIPYFTCAVDTENIKRVFKGCSEILKKEHLEKSGLL